MSSFDQSDAISVVAAPAGATPAAWRPNWKAIGVLLAAFGVLPFVANDYWLNAMLIPFLVLALAGLGLNLLTGFAGQASLGAGALMSVGAFASYNFLLRLPALPLPLSLALGGVAAAAVGLVFGLPSLRIKGFYLLASTLGAQFFVEWAFTKYEWFSNYASSGSISAPHLALFGRDLSSPVGRYLITVSTVVALTWISLNLVRSQAGLAWTAIRDMDTAAAVIGIPVVRTKLTAFVVSSFILGIAGALWAFAYLGTADAHSFGIDRSFQILFIIIIGGLGSIAGSYIGAAFILVLPILLDRAMLGVFGSVIDTGLLENLQKIIFGSLIIFLLIREPRGLTAYVTRLLRPRPAR
ncbi:MAG: branched-chain amino acid ABC transporter permease [Methylocella sp.]